MSIHTAIDLFLYVNIHCCYQTVWRTNQRCVM